MTRGMLDVCLPAGEYRWEYTKGKPAPMPARITSTEYEAGRVKLHIARTSPCDAVIVQVSTDGGKTWTDQGRATGDVYYLPQGADGKVHVRALAANGTRTAAEANEYPLYFTTERPHHPEGLWLRTDSNR